MKTIHTLALYINSEQEQNYPHPCLVHQLRTRKKLSSSLPCISSTQNKTIPTLALYIINSEQNYPHSCLVHQLRTKLSPLLPYISTQNKTIPTLALYIRTQNQTIPTLALYIRTQNQTIITLALYINSEQERNYANSCLVH